VPEVKHLKIDEYNEIELLLSCVVVMFVELEICGVKNGGGTGACFPRGSSRSG